MTFLLLANFTGPGIADLFLHVIEEFVTLLIVHGADQRRFLHCILEITPGIGTKIPADTNTAEYKLKQKIVADFISQGTNTPEYNPMNDVPPLFDSTVNVVIRQVWLNFYEYKNFGFQNRRNVFAWQLVSSKIIFFVVILTCAIRYIFCRPSVFSRYEIEHENRQHGKDNDYGIVRVG